MINYFEFFGIEPSFYPDLHDLKKQFYAKSREFHPDFYTQSSDEDKANALQQSSIINAAYKTLQNPDLRFRHILRIANIIQEDTKDEMQQSFLMEMMDFNEEIMDLQFDFNESKHKQLKDQLTQIKDEKFENNKSLMEQYPDIDAASFHLLKNLYFEYKYLARLEENLVSIEQNIEKGT